MDIVIHLIHFNVTVQNFHCSQKQLMDQVYSLEQSFKMIAEKS